MTVHAQVEAMLTEMAKSPVPSPPDASLEEARAAYEERALAYALKDVVVGKVENETLPGPGGDIPIRIYTPVAAGRSVPGVVFFHGGGFVLGGLDSHDAMARALTRASGCKLISVDYRLAPEHPFPAAIEDACAAVRWVEKHAMDLGIDPNAVAVAGESAGGNIAAVVCQQMKGSGTSIAFQLLLYPMMQMTGETPSRTAFADGYFLRTADLGWYLDHYVPESEDRTDPRLAPVAAVDLSGLPPAYIVTAENDPLRDEGRIYDERLIEADVDVTYVNYDGMVHGFLNYAGVLDDGKRALEAAGAALGAALKG